MIDPLARVQAALAAMADGVLVADTRSGVVSCNAAARTMLGIPPDREVTTVYLKDEVGFYPFDTATVELPFELSIDTQSIGGPSAGLAFTLTLIDELTRGELTPPGGVAVTGTMALDGAVGPIGGLRQKASAVAQTGVATFIVPAAQGDDDIAAAEKAAGGDLDIIPVSTLDEALAALKELGGDPLP